jgi:hypothetical protein
VEFIRRIQTWSQKRRKRRRIARARREAKEDEHVSDSEKEEAFWPAAVEQEETKEDEWRPHEVTNEVVRGLPPGPGGFDTSSPNPHHGAQGPFQSVPVPDQSLAYG